MPKNDKKKKNAAKSRKGSIEAKRELPLADQDQGYAIVSECCGNRRFKLECQDGINRMGHLRGAIRKRKKTWLKLGSWLIYAERIGFTGPRRSSDLEKCDIIEILADDEVARLRGLGEIQMEQSKQDDNCGFEFTEEDDKKEINFDDI